MIKRNLWWSRNGWKSRKVKVMLRAQFPCLIKCFVVSHSTLMMQYSAFNRSSWLLIEMTWGKCRPVKTVTAHLNAQATSSPPLPHLSPHIKFAMFFISLWKLQIGPSVWNALFWKKLQLRTFRMTNKDWRLDQTVELTFRPQLWKRHNKYR